MIVLAQTPSPSPTDSVKYPDPTLVTPGTIGFLATALVVVLTIFLIRDAVRRVRRVRARDDAKTVSHFPIERNPRRRPAGGGPAVPSEDNVPDAPAPRSVESEPAGQPGATGGSSATGRSSVADQRDLDDDAR